MPNLPRRTFRRKEPIDPGPDEVLILRGWKLVGCPWYSWLFPRGRAIILELLYYHIGFAIKNIYFNPFWLGYFEDLRLVIIIRYAGG